MGLTAALSHSGTGSHFRALLRDPQRTSITALRHTIYRPDFRMKML
jgi:hypothetical protein